MAQRPFSPCFDDASYFVEACRRGEFTKARDMLGNMPELLNAADPTGWSGLHYAAHANHQDVVQLLVDAKADIDALNGANETALQSAVTKSFLDVVLILIRAGADPNLKNPQNLSAFDMATSDEIRKALGGFDPRETPASGGFFVAEADEDSE